MFVHIICTNISEQTTDILKHKWTEGVENYEAFTITVGAYVLHVSITEV